MDKLNKTCPTTEIYTSGLNVGLPDGQMGNSEVGHTNIGAGRIVYQQLTKITKYLPDAKKLKEKKNDGDTKEPEKKESSEKLEINNENPLIWFVFFEGAEKTLYENEKFKVKIEFSNEYVIIY